MMLCVNCSISLFRRASSSVAHVLLIGGLRASAVQLNALLVNLNVPTLLLVDVAATAAVDTAKVAGYAQRHIYNDLCRRKCSDFWASTVEADRNNPRKLWQSLDRLLGRRRVPASDVIDVADFSRFFVEKVDKVRRSAQRASSPVFPEAKSGAVLSSFEIVTADDVISAVRRLPDKTSAADPIMTSILKLVIDIIAPFVVELLIILWQLVSFLASTRMRSSPH
jgi:hypothetical protein